MEKRYQLPITLLLDSTKGIYQQLFFQTTLPPQRISQEACFVRLRVCNGVVLSCEIKEATGRLLTAQPEEALATLASLGMLEWYSAPLLVHGGVGLPEQRPLSRQEGSHQHVETRLRPMRQNSNADRTIKELGHLHRQVFGLADGTRGVEDIARLLRKDKGAILAILQELQAQELMIFLPGT
jgi:hypothetical protein